MLETAQVLAQGYNVFETDKRPSGVVKYLASPQDVIGLIQSGKLKEHILLVRGGTTTFLAPALSMGAIGVITMSGAPESHLGILSRESTFPRTTPATCPVRPTTRTSRPSASVSTASASPSRATTTKRARCC